MNRKQKKELRQRQSAQQLMGIDRLTDHGVKTPRGELVYFLIRPDNLSVLSAEVIRSRIRALMELLGGIDTARLLALDSRESFQRNKLRYQERLEREDNPAVRELLRQDMAHLDTIQTTTASAREFAIAYALERQSNENTEALLSAIPLPDPDVEATRRRILLKGDIPSPVNLGPGCPFASRCPHVKPICREQQPALKEVSPGHFAACHEVE